MKFLLMLLGTSSVLMGAYFGEVLGHQNSMLIGYGLGVLLIFVALILAISELPRFIRRRNRH